MIHIKKLTDYDSYPDCYELTCDWFPNLRYKIFDFFPEESPLGLPEKWTNDHIFAYFVNYIDCLEQKYKNITEDYKKLEAHHIKRGKRLSELLKTIKNDNHSC